MKPDQSTEKKTFGQFVKRTLVNFLLLAAGSVLFSFAFPSFISRWGFSFLAFFALIPVFILTRRITLAGSFIYGAIYGYLTYMLFNFWLASFDPVSFVVVPVVYTGYFLWTFPLLTLAHKAFPKRSYLFQGLFFLCYEVIRTWGFLGYSYGILGYSQYRFTSFIGIADILGPYAVSAMVIFPSAFLTHLLTIPGGLAVLKDKEFWKRKAVVLPVVLYSGLFFLFLTYGWISKVDYSDSPTWRPALIQHNNNAWMSGLPVYRKSYENLTRLSDQALKENPDVIIWSETSFVPAIEYHNRYRIERGKFELVRELLEYLEEKDIPYLIGNNDSYQQDGKRISYNAALQFEGDEVVDRYHKIRLVPFSEHFPMGHLMPRFDRYIRSTGASYYEKGERYTVFTDGRVDYSAMICYEDTFPYLSRNFVREGAEVLVTITNDSWSKAEACSLQHYTMAVFRSVENRRTMVRSTTGGFTSVIDPNGKLLGSLEPFTEGYLVMDVPVYTERTTLFTRTGDWLSILIVVAGGFSLFAAFILLLKKKKAEEE